MAKESQEKTVEIDRLKAENERLGSKTVTPKPEPAPKRAPTPPPVEIIKEIEIVKEVEVRVEVPRPLRKLYK